MQENGNIFIHINNEIYYILYITIFITKIYYLHIYTYHIIFTFIYINILDIMNILILPHHIKSIYYIPFYYKH